MYNRIEIIDSQKNLIEFNIGELKLISCNGVPISKRDLVLAVLIVQQELSVVWAKTGLIKTTGLNIDNLPTGQKEEAYRYKNF